MEMNQNRIAAAGFELPEEIIQQIQSYIHDEEYAARTALLNKSWHRAWLTRPNLHFDQFYFRDRMDEFPDFTKKTMQRYEDRNRNIHTFRLQMYEYEDHSLPSQLILKAINLGAHNLDILIAPKIGFRNHEIFALPDEVFQSETLTRLSVCSCEVNLMRREEEAIVTFPNLRSLNLSEVDVKGDLIEDLISRCPSIEELTLLVNPPTPRTLLLFDVAMLIQLHKLKYLRLEGLDIGDSLSRSDLWPKFACLKELVVAIPLHCKPDVRICSTSLERVTLRSYDKNRIAKVELNAPNLKKFVFKGESENLPRLGKSSREWEADVKITCHLRRNVLISASWFSSLNRLAKKLGRSRVSLEILLRCGQDDGNGYLGDGLAIPALENLTITGRYKMSLAFLDALFCSCRPNFVSIERHCVLGVDREKVEEFPRLQSLPWMKLLDAARGHWELVCFQLE